MNFDFYSTNKDCESCARSRVIDISSDYEEHMWQCDLGHKINNQLDDNNKGCKLPKGHYYVATYSIFNPLKEARKKKLKNIDDAERRIL